MPGSRCGWRTRPVQVIVRLQALADEVVRDAAAQEEYGAFIFATVRARSSSVGVSPPNEQTLREDERARGAVGATSPGGRVARP